MNIPFQLSYGIEKRFGQIEILFNKVSIALMKLQTGDFFITEIFYA